MRRGKTWRVGVDLFGSRAAEAAHCEEPENEHEAEGGKRARLGRGKNKEEDARRTMMTSLVIQRMMYDQQLAIPRTLLWL